MHRIDTGLDRIASVADRLTGVRVGLMTHPAGVDRNYVSGIDILHDSFRLTALVACEHGIRGDVQAGGAVGDDVDPETGVPVFSAYGGDHHVPDAALDEIDALVIDLQDVGSRYYTYLYSMAFAMQDCARKGKRVFVLDRINPVGGVTVEGTLLDERFSSFIGEYAVPSRYALTIGEFARFVREHLSLDVDLTVVPMEGWRREDLLPELCVPWVAPSPNLPTWTGAALYPGACLFEGTNVSEGRGTTQPFELIGAPWIDAARLEKTMNELCLPGVRFRRASFTPTFSKYAGEACRGVQIHVTDARAARPFRAALLLLETIWRMHPDAFGFLPSIDHILGTDQYRLRQTDAEGLIRQNAPQIEDFARRSEKYRLYD